MIEIKLTGDNNLVQRVINFRERKDNMVTWEQLKDAFNVFSGDYNIVNHPDTPPGSPLSAPNKPLIHEGELVRQYNATNIPEGMTEAEFLDSFKARDTILISCMDKDAVGPSYNLLREKGKKIFLISMAGGVIQEHQERANALNTIMKYLGQHGPHIQEVYATGHNHTCGYIKHAMNIGISLAEKLKTHPASPEEDNAMKQMILFHTQIIKGYFGDKVIPALVKIDRLGKALFDFDFTGIEQAKLEELIQ